MSSIVARSTAFAFGLGLALLPAIGPFLAALIFISSRLQARRSDVAWVAAAVLYAAPSVLAGDLASAASSGLQIAAGWLIYRSFAGLARFDETLLRHRYLDTGLLVGLALIIGLNLMRVEAWNFSTAKTIAQAIVWDSSPALFGHTVLVLGGLIAVVTRSRTVRLVALSMAALGILVSGSREAAVGWVVVAMSTALAESSTSWRGRVGQVAMIAIIVAAVSTMGPMVGWGKVGYLLQPSESSGGRNLLQGTEVPAGDWWDTSWVSVEQRDVTLSGNHLASYLVRKNGEESWLRLQQAVELQPDRRYTVSAWMLEGHPDLRPGIQGWGQYTEADGASTFVVAGVMDEGEWSANVIGPGRLADAGIAERSGPWSRVFMTFEFAGGEALPWFVGLVPDTRPRAGSANEFAAFQLEEGDLSPYEPGVATRGLGLGIARLPYWRAAWEGIQERPLLGWRDGRFSEYFVDARPGQSRIQVVPAHPHNFFLHIWFERGVIGLTGILLFLALLIVPAVKRRDLAVIALLLAVLFANVFDSTLLYGGVFYPLLAIAGWRTARLVRDRDNHAGVARQIMARMGLAMADTVAAALAVLGALLTAQTIGPWVGISISGIALPASAMYGLLLWPLLSWREGLYPGYGLTPQQELKKQTTVALYAALIVAAAAVAMPTFPPLPAPVMLLIAIFSFITLPVGRAGAKRLLQAGEFWGRPVLVLGAGRTGSRIVRALLRTPLDGLHPVALFDDDPTLAGTSAQGVPIAGTLEDADAFADDHDVRHAIVAIPSLGQAEVRDLLDKKGRTFRIVQYVPSLAGLPAQDVYASSLDGMLAIEVRNNLAIKRNRIAKRAIDLFASVIGGILISPILLGLAIAIRLDSTGPVVFGHPRIGLDGKPFLTWKFRTMVRDADSALERHLLENPHLRREWEDSHKLQDDPRVTRVGKFLRRMSLDELPQLLNVIRGEMSLVGPRPIVIAEVEKYGDAFELYASVRPGITGYWQVSGRSETAYFERVELDSYYVRNWSVWLDIVILVRTLKVVATGTGAY